MREPVYSEMDEPLVRGGQGRTDDEVRDDGGAFVAAALGALFLGLTVGAFIVNLYVAACIGAVLTVLVVVASYLMMLEPKPEIREPLDMDG